MYIKLSNCFLSYTYIGLPIPIVAISAGIANDKYGINDR